MRKQKFTIVQWLEDRRKNCLRIAKLKVGKDRDVSNFAEGLEMETRPDLGGLTIAYKAYQFGPSVQRCQDRNNLLLGYGLVSFGGFAVGLILTAFMHGFFLAVLGGVLAGMFVAGLILRRG